MITISNISNILTISIVIYLYWYWRFANHNRHSFCILVHRDTPVQIGGAEDSRGRPNGWFSQTAPLWLINDAGYECWLLVLLINDGY